MSLHEWPETPHDDSLTPAELELVIAVCERFDQAWKQGRTPRLEEFQGEVPEPLRPRLRRELRALEIELRAAQGGRSGQVEDSGLGTDQTGSIAVIATSGRDFRSTVSRVEDAGEVAATADLGIRARCRTPGSFESTDPTVEPARKALGNLTPPSLLEATQPHPTAESWSKVSAAGYEILSPIGRGGMEVVLKARDRSLNRLVALKLIHNRPHARPDLLVRLRIEAEALASLRHENIVQVYDVGELEGDPVVALEYLEGGRLPRSLTAHPSLTIWRRGCHALSLARSTPRTKPGSFIVT